MIGLLDQLAAKHHVFISDLRLIPALRRESLGPALRRESLGELQQMSQKERYPLKEWEDAVSYLSGQIIRISSKEDIDNVLTVSLYNLR